MAKIPTINLSYSQEYETLLTSSNMACSDIITWTANHCLSRLLRIVTRVQDFVWMSYICTYLITG